jgi:hypothetical protein
VVEENGKALIRFSILNFIYLLMSNLLRDELFNILSGKSKVSNGSIIQTITSYLKESERTDSIFEKQQHFKNQEAKRLVDLHDENVLTQNEMLFFIDTVFYLKGSFWEYL